MYDPNLILSRPIQNLDQREEKVLVALSFLSINKSIIEEREEKVLKYFDEFIPKLIIHILIVIFKLCTDFVFIFRN